MRSTTNRVLRGGSWNNNTNNVRSSYRNNNTPDNTNNNIGFRVASTP
ncbi:MAG: SUMF1/EgtB/PvdO family nonheme iron enzyme [Planctomycetota bacterium]|nr:SUMF1/EgtB/PvdO family nonheme iron enzyme [Planctomycetota bacterium]